MPLDTDIDTDKSSEIMKPCPFCGGDVYIDGYLASAMEVEEGTGVDSYYAECDTCSYHLPTQLTHEKAIKVWNTRATVNPWVKIEDIPQEWKDGRFLDLMVSNSIHEPFGNLSDLAFAVRWCDCVFNDQSDEFHHADTDQRINEVFVTHAMLPIEPPK